MQISILDMGKTKKRNVRESIISVLSKQYPLTIRKIYQFIKKEHKLEVTYQAVFKVVKEMLCDNILQRTDSRMEYQLNIEWIKQLEDELKFIRNNYNSKDKDKGKETQDNIHKFVFELGPVISKYIGSDKSAIVGISGGGRLYGMALWRHLLREGKDCKYVDYDPVEEVMKKGIGIKTEDVENRKVLIIDSAIYSGRTYETVLRKINLFKKKLKIKELKCVVDKDMAGQSDFCRIKG